MGYKIKTESVVPYKYLCKWRLLDTNEGNNPIVKVAGVSGEYILNEVASEIWLLMDGRRTIRDIASIISKKYEEVSISEVEKDIIEFLDQFEQKDVIIIDYNSLFPYKKLNAIREDKDE